MKNKIKIISLLLIMILLSTAFYSSHSIMTAYAEDGDIRKNIVIYDEYSNYLFEKSEVFIGDEYLSKDFKKYEVVYVNHESKTGVARFVKQIKKPNVKISPTPSQVNVDNKKIKLYSTHNDESYEPSDGYYTVYGKGGIHDVGNALKTSLQNKGISVEYDESLHLPHDNYAYNRSKTTAGRLLNEKGVDAIFDIHRDGIPKKYYATKNHLNQDASKIRIVVGKSNPEMSKNEDFAIYLTAVAEELYPWLISDIYYASGHYNQNLFPKSLLFEMGTYLIEKEYVMRSIDPLSHVIDVALYNTTVNKNTGDLEIGGDINSEQDIVNEILNPIRYTSVDKVINTILITLGFIAGVVVLTWFSYYIYSKYYSKSDIKLGGEDTDNLDDSSVR